jgi:AraC family transcriptional regulator
MTRMRGVASEILQSHVLRGGSRVRLVRYRGGERHPPHAHGFTSLTLVLGGGVEEQVGRSVERGTAFSVVVKPAGVEHADQFGPSGAMTLRVELSAGDEARTASSGCWPGRWRWIHAGDSSRALFGMLRTLRLPGGAWSRSSPALPPGQDESLDDLLCEAISAVPPAEPARRAPPAWLARVRDALQEEGASVRALAGHEGIHPVVLARQFRLHQGMSPTAYRRLARARRAAALLADTQRPLVDVALDTGYCDQAHLTRDLRSLLGATPGTVRTLTLPL